VPLAGLSFGYTPFPCRLQPSCHARLPLMSQPVCVCCGKRELFVSTRPSRPRSPQRLMECGQSGSISAARERIREPAEATSICWFSQMSHHWLSAGRSAADSSPLEGTFL